MGIVDRFVNAGRVLFGSPAAPPSSVELAKPDVKPTFGESGTSGIRTFAGLIREAYSEELYWPTCIPVYNRIWRSDPEIALAKAVLETLSGRVEIGSGFPAIPEGKKAWKPSDDDKKAQEFLYQVIDDVQDGINTWLATCMTRVPLYGWGWWEAPAGKREPGWVSPGDDEWTSQYDDGLIGIRKLSFRHYASWWGWDMTRNGTVKGFVQMDPPHPTVTIPLDQSLHVKFGDMANPEGVATMEPIWRLERIKYGLEIVQGIGFEHSAGYLDVKAEKELGDADKANVKAAARAVLTAQEGNYALWPSGFTGELKDSPFQAAVAILDAIRYYGLLKLGILGMQWAALGTLSPYGSYSSIRDASGFFVTMFNSMVDGFVRQLDQQIGKRVFDYNKDAFPGMTRRPRIIVTRKVEKGVDLLQLAQFAQTMNAVMPLTNEDIAAVRRTSEILPDIASTTPRRPVPAPQAKIPMPAPSGEVPIDNTPKDKAKEPKLPDANNHDTKDAQLASRKVGLEDDELPIDVTDESIIDEKDIARAVRNFKKWAKSNAPTLSGLLDASIMVEPEHKNGGK